MSRRANAIRSPTCCPSVSVTRRTWPARSSMATGWRGASTTSSTMSASGIMCHRFLCQARVRRVPRAAEQPALDRLFRSETRHDCETSGSEGIHRFQHLAGMLQRQGLADEPGRLQAAGLDERQQARVVGVRVADASGDLDLALDDVVERERHIAFLLLTGQANLNEPAALAQGQHRRLDQAGGPEP